jgi:hypothetical protein
MSLQKGQRMRVTMTTGAVTEGQMLWVYDPSEDTAGNIVMQEQDGELVVVELSALEPWRGPLPGSWASIAQIMAEGDDSGFDWDSWKDEMKERDC